MAKAPRRSPEELAAYHQRKANIARAKSKRAAKDTEVKRQLELGRAALEVGLVEAADLGAAQVALRLIESWFGPRGPVKLAGEPPRLHWAAMMGLPQAPGTAIDLDPLVKWWDAKAYPAQGPATPSQGAQGS